VTTVPSARVVATFGVLTTCAIACVNRLVDGAPCTGDVLMALTNSRSHVAIATNRGRSLLKTDGVPLAWHPGG
jgi:hypothetical protein